MLIVKIFAWLSLPSIAFFIYQKVRSIRVALNAGHWRYPGVDLYILASVLCIAAMLVYVIAGG